jgi:hypothetical protein
MVFGGQDRFQGYKGSGTGPARGMPSITHQDVVQSFEIAISKEPTLSDGNQMNSNHNLDIENVSPTYGLVFILGFNAWS